MGLASLAPLAAEASFKEARLVWLPEAAAAREEGEHGKAEVFLDQARLRMTLAARAAPWEPAYQLGLARLATELGALLSDRLAGDLAAAGGADEYDPAVIGNAGVALALSRDEAFARAVAASEAAARRDPVGPEPALTRARTLRVWAELTASGAPRSERLALAAAGYESAAMRAPGWPEVLDEAAWVALMQDDGERALELGARALTLDQYFLRAHRTRSTAFDVLGHDDLAAASLAVYFGDARNTSDLAARRAQLRVLARLGRTAEALTVARAVVALAPADAHAHADLAVILSEAGDRRGAVQSAATAAALAPGDSAIQGLVKELEPPD